MNTTKKLAFNWPQNEKLKLIFPFKLNETKISLTDFLFKLNDLQGWQRRGIIQSNSDAGLSNLISPSSRHFDHIERLYTKNEFIKDEFGDFIAQNTHIFEFSIKKPSEFKNELDKYFDCIDEKIQISDIELHNKRRETLLNAFNSTNYVYSDVRFIVFASGIFFLVITLENFDNVNIEDYYYRYYVIKRYFKRVDIKQLIHQIIIPKSRIDGSEVSPNLKKSDCFTAFDMDMDRTVRFQVFTIHKFGVDSSVVDSDFQQISNYFLNKNAIENNDSAKLSIEKSIILFSKCRFYATSEGASMLCKEEEDGNSIFIRLAYKAVEQNVFFSYILVLHQYYYMHNILRDIGGIVYHNTKEVEKVLELGLSKYSKLQTKYLFKVVSQFEYQQKVYEFIQEKYRIAALSEEIKDATKPLFELVKSKKNGMLDKTFKLLTVVTITNAGVTLLTSFLSGILFLFNIDTQVRHIFVYINLGSIGIMIALIIAILYNLNQKYYKELKNVYDVNS